MGYLKKDYKLIGFEKSKSKGKKYAAIIEGKETGRRHRVNFGDSRYGHYRDKTGLGIYSAKDHGDSRRREMYQKRHRTFLNKKQFSPAYFSWFYLW